MSIQEIFEKGISFMEFVNQDEDAYKEKTIEIYEQISIDENLENEIKSVKEVINVLAFAEIWCPDCMINVPALQKMGDQNPNFKLSIVSREGNESYMEAYKVGGKPKIPTFVFLNDKFEAMGVFVERPTVVKQVEANGKETEVIVVKRKYKKGEYIKNTIEEILDILKK